MDNLALVVRSTDHAHTLENLTALLDELEQAIPTRAFNYVLNAMGWGTARRSTPCPEL